MLDHKDFLIGLEDLKRLRRRKKEIKEEEKKVNQDIDAILYPLIEYMEVTKQDGVRVKDIGMCSLTHTKQYSIENPEIFEKWMEENDDMQSVMAINAQKVHGYYKEKLELNEELPPGIKTFIKTNIRIGA